MHCFPGASQSAIYYYNSNVSFASDMRIVIGNQLHLHISRMIFPNQSHRPFGSKFAMMLISLISLIYRTPLWWKRGFYTGKKTKEFISIFLHHSKFAETVRKIFAHIVKLILFPFGVCVCVRTPATDAMNWMLSDVLNVHFIRNSRKTKWKIMNKNIVNIHMKIVNCF